MQSAVHEEVADLLLAAYQTREPVDPLTGKYPDLTVIADAIPDPAGADRAAGSRPARGSRGTRSG